MVVDWRTKSFAAQHRGRSIAELVQSQVVISELPTPVLTLDASAVEHNIRTMRAFTDLHGVELAPHGKTTMSPALWRRQIDAGAWAITVATPWQLGVAHAAGVKRIVHAGAVLAQADLRYIADIRSEDPDLHVYIWVDSAESASVVSSGYPDSAPPLEVLVERGAPSARTGARSGEECLAAARTVRAADNLQLCGVTAWEGSLRGTASESVRAVVASFCDGVADSYEAIASNGMFDETPDPLVSAGGSKYFDVVVERWGERLAAGSLPPRIVLRSGCYLTHDDGMYQKLSPFVLWDGPQLRPALHLWTQVVSRPEPQLALLNAGRRDAPHDGALPVPQLVRGRDDVSSSRPLQGAFITQLDDQHGYLKLSEHSDLRLGEVIRCGISHPCTAFDKWRVIPVVDSAEASQPRLIGAIRTFF